MRWLLYICLATACGRFGFESTDPTDAQIDAAIDAPPAPVIGSGMGGGSTTGADSQTLQMAVTPTTPGNLIVVAFTIHDGHSVTGISDSSGNTYVSANVRADMAATSSEIWYASETASTDTVTVTMDQASSFDAWVMEFAGVRGAPAQTTTNCLQYPPDIVQAPLVTTVPDELIVTATMFAYPLFVSAMNPPFTGRAPITGNDSGYLIAHDPGSYASTFVIDSGQGMTAMTCASSVAWNPR
ncbi:MAG: hypothetical protein QM831_03070 [Kofleriaceae bacterium]